MSCFDYLGFTEQFLTSGMRANLQAISKVSSGLDSGGTVFLLRKVYSTSFIICYTFDDKKHSFTNKTGTWFREGLFDRHNIGTTCSS